MSNNINDNQELKNSELDPTQEEELEVAEIIRRKKEKKLEKVCLSAIKNLTLSQPFWLLFIVVLGFLAIAGIYLNHKTDYQTLLNGLSNWKFESLITATLFLIFTALALSRIMSNSSVIKRLHERRLYTKELPKESNKFIRETYFFYCRRRCIHFWLSFAFGGLFVLCMLYCLVGMGIDALVQLGEPKHVKLYELSTWKDITKWTTAHKWFITGAVGFVLALVQFFVFRDNYKKVIYAFEEKYGRERIVDECLYSTRMWHLNFKYKAFAFILLCFLGCFFYILFKRLLCVIFDKSFVF